MRRLALVATPELALGLRHDDTLIERHGADPADPVTLSLWARGDVGLERVELRAVPDGEEERSALRLAERRGGLCRWEVTIGPRVRRLRYRFRLHLPGGARYLTMAGLSVHNPIDAFDFTLLTAEPPPDWPLDAVLYQVFPDRFADGDPGNNVRDGEWTVFGVPTVARPFGERPAHFRVGRNADFYGGDLAGIEQHLDHVAGLGATGVFLNPIWPALSNHRYDLSDHGHVDPHLGGDAALGSLAAALRARAMRLVLDVVINHTGTAHPWWTSATSDPASPFRDYYLFEKWPTVYRGWNNLPSLPRLNLANPRLRDELYRGEAAALRRFLRPPFSVDGYRFDVANQMGRDGAEQHHRELWVDVRRALRAERPEAWILGEHFFDPEKLLKGDGVDGVMGYHGFTLPLRAFLTGRERDDTPSAIDGRGFMEAVRECWARVGFAAWRLSSMHVNSHDLPRLQTDAGGLSSSAGQGALDVATALQLAMPGVPCLYYGDEVGLEGGADPDNRRCMEWDERRWDRRRLDYTRARVAERRASPALRRGGFVDLGSAGDVIAFARILHDEVKLVVASRAADPVEVTLDLTGLGRPPTTVTLAPRSARTLDAP